MVRVPRRPILVSVYDEVYVCKMSKLKIRLNKNIHTNNIAAANIILYSYFSLEVILQSTNCARFLTDGDCKYDCSTELTE